MSIAALFMIDKKWKQPKCPSTGEWLEKTWHICTTDYHSDANLATCNNMDGRRGRCVK